MRVLITGHAGFIGQNLVKYIEDNTDWVIGTYNYGDIFPLVSEHDWVIHLGAISSTTEKDIDKLLTQNTEFSIKLYEDCRKYGTNFQYSSSASVYGMGTNFTEDAQLDPINAYAWSKYLFDRHVSKRSPGIRVHGLRYFNVYGSNEEHKGNQASPVTKFTQQAKETGKITLFEGSTDYIRDFICVEDICRIHIDMIKKNVESGIYNVGTGNPYSFQEVADIIGKKYKAEFKYIPIPENIKRSYQKFTCSDNTKIESVLGKQNYITIEEFLEQVNLS